MPTITIGFLGDVVGRPGRAAAVHAARVLRAPIEQGGYACDAIIANAENAAHGRGLHLDGYRELRGAGLDAITLGDHWSDKPMIFGLLENPNEPISMPVNATPSGSTDVPSAKPFVTIDVTPKDAPTQHVTLCAFTVLCRSFMNRPGEDPFAAIDETMTRIIGAHPNALVFLETHGEATAEKAGLAWHAARTHPGRIIAISGTHTHVQTNDARLLEHAGHAAGFLTDAGMCGSWDGVTGFTVESSIKSLQRTQGARLQIDDDGAPRACGVVFEIDTASRSALSARAVQVPCE
ncbi:MAG: YmdB family metallophosphoesterase [Planctomycetota bacterium]